MRRELRSGHAAVFGGLVLLVWFGAFAKGLYDDWAASVAFAVLTALAIALLELARRSRDPLRFPLLAPWLIWLACAWRSTLHSFDVTTSFWEAWTWTFCMVAFYIAVNMAHRLSVSARRTFLVAMGACAIPLTIMALTQQWTGQPVGYGAMHLPLLGTLRYGHWEIHATLVNSIVLAGFLLNWAFVAAPASPSPWRWTIPVCVGLGILLSRSWTMVGGFLLGGALYLGIQRGRMTASSILKLALPALLVAALALAWKTHQQVEGQYYNASMRLTYWRAAVDMLRFQPATGIGLGAYGVALPFFKQAAGENTRLAHGVLWQIGAETGIPGLLTFLGLILAIGVTAWRSARHEEPETRALGVTLGILLLCGLTTIHFDYFLNRLVAVLFAGILCAQAPTRVVLKATPFANLIAIPCLITISALWLSLFRAEQFYAAGDYRGALRLNPRLADSWYALSKRYPEPLAAQLRQTAWHWKKDPRFLRPNGG